MISKNLGFILKLFYGYYRANDYVNVLRPNTFHVRDEPYK